MRVFSTITLAGLLAAGAGVLAITPAAANRCGLGYPVDHPTTLVEVAQRCNVNLSELYEANPGVDPRNVRPGEHLALPDERRANESYVQATPQTASGGAEASDKRPTSAHPFIANYGGPVTDDYGLRNVYEVDEYLRGEHRTRHRIRIRDKRVSRQAPVWLRPEATLGGHYSSSDRLSYQARSKFRLAAANTPRFAGRQNPSTRLVECDGLRDAKGSKIHQVHNVIAKPGATFVEISDNPAGGYDCTLFNSASSAVAGEPGVPLARFTYGSVIAPRSAYAPIGIVHTSSANFALEGDIVAVSDGCLMMRTGNNEIWRLAAAPPSGDLLGKRVMVWGSTAATGTCGAGPTMLVNHAVYAEPWLGK